MQVSQEGRSLWTLMVDGELMVVEHSLEKTFQRFEMIRGPGHCFDDNWLIDVTTFTKSCGVIMLEEPVEHCFCFVFCRLLFWPLAWFAAVHRVFASNFVLLLCTYVHKAVASKRQIEALASVEISSYLFCFGFLFLFCFFCSHIKLI